MVITLIGVSLAVFVVSLIMGSLWFRVRMSIQSSNYLLKPEMVVRIKTSAGMYRTRFSGEFGRHLRFESPIARQLFVPIRIGESVTIEASTKKGVVLFRSKVIDRVETTHELIVEKPSVISQFDRRDCRRFVCDDLEVAAKVDGVSVQLMDVSEKGAKVRMIGEFEKGERISVRLPWLEGEVGAWVIDSEKVGRGEDTGLIVRMVFEEPVKLPRRVSLA